MLVFHSTVNRWETSFWKIIIFSLTFECYLIFEGIMSLSSGHYYFCRDLWSYPNFGSFVVSLFSLWLLNTFSSSSVGCDVPWLGIYWFLFILFYFILFSTLKTFWAFWIWSFTTLMGFEESSLLSPGYYLFPIVSILSV